MHNVNGISLPWGLGKGFGKPPKSSILVAWTRFEVAQKPDFQGVERGLENQF